jgi:type I phosphodiesterase/nucleotide pyrophosphatase
MPTRSELPGRVVFLVLDGLPASAVTAGLTPRLAAWAAASNTAPSNVPSMLPASTYANHATFVTGVEPARHGIVANHVRVGSGTFRRAAKIGPQVPTVFDATAAADRHSALVVGDQELVGVMGGRTASTHWPLDGALPDGARLDAHGYLADTATLPELLHVLDSDAELVVAQLNSPDTAGHVHGPETTLARDVYQAVDVSIGEIQAAVAARADDTVTIIVSDHSMEPITVDEPVDLTATLDGTGLEWFPEGSAALVYGEHPDADRVLADAPDLAGSRLLTPGVRIVWPKPGRWMCFAGIDAEPGSHGSPRTAHQLAAVVGDHPAVREVDALVRGATFDARSWAPTIANLLGLELTAR